ncbi:thioesterase-like superfamily protein [Sarocladium implicatum]|nr:thioesterase-like superfamily protein [Sarocladium implicatum]
MAGEERVTLLRPPPKDDTKAPIENALEVTEMAVLGKDIFTNARPLWHPPGARGIYGGAVIAQSLASAQVTVPDDFLPHSCHCYFLLAGDSAIPVLYHVERVRDGRSFATRTVQARQRGHCIFTTTVSFVKDRGDAQEKQVRHAQKLPEGVAGTEPKGKEEEDEDKTTEGGPVMSRMLKMDSKATEVWQKKCKSWTRAKGKISSGGGRRAHLNALAYMSDSYFIGTVSRVHRLWRFPFRPSMVPSLPASKRKLVEEDSCRPEGMTLDEWEDRPTVGMQVSLDHSIYFHEPRRVMADEWMFVEMESPWAGDGRGVVIQRVWARDGTLLATCMQEGVVRLKKDGTEKSAKI